MSSQRPVGTPEMVGPYRLLQRLGEGGMGVVHLGLDEEGRAVAVKLLRPHIADDEEARQRLAREVATLRRVQHPQVAAVIDADVDGDRPYLVTHFVPGKPLDAHVRQHGPLPRGHVARIGAVLADALRSIHAAGIVHRDLKPANVMLLDGDPVLIDFGIAHLADESRITRTGLVMGTPGYLSPEVIGGEDVTPATDWWGWGATLAFAATGRPPFGTGPVEVVLDRVRRGASDLEGVDAGLAATLSAALAVDAGRRPEPALLVAGLAATPGRPAIIELPKDPEPVHEAVTVRAPVEPVTAHMAPPTKTRAFENPAPAVQAPPPYPYPHPQPQVRWAPPPHQPPPPASPAPVVQPQPDVPAPLSEPDRGMLVGVAAALAAVATVAPVGAVWTAALLTLVARIVDRSRTAMIRRRDLRGPRGGDGVVAAFALPWQIIAATTTTVFAMVLPVLVGISSAFIIANVTAAGEATATRPGSPTSLAGGMVALLLIVWFGPGGGSVRHGARVSLKTVSGLPNGRIAVWAVLGLIVVAAVIVIGKGADPDWGPLEDSWLLNQLSR